MAWDDCYTVRDYDRYAGYDQPDETEDTDNEPAPCDPATPDVSAEDSTCPF